MKKEMEDIVTNNGLTICRMDHADIDEFGNPVERTKETHPYNYDGFMIWRGDKNEEANDTSWTDHLFTWDPDKHNALCKKHFGDTGQRWNKREPKKVEAFLRDYHDNQNIKLIFIMQYCNQAFGSPLWRLVFFNSDAT